MPDDHDLANAPASPHSDQDAEARRFPEPLGPEAPPEELLERFSFIATILDKVLPDCPEEVKLQAIRDYASERSQVRALSLRAEDLHDLDDPGRPGSALRGLHVMGRDKAHPRLTRTWANFAAVRGDGIVEQGRVQIEKVEAWGMDSGLGKEPWPRQLAAAIARGEHGSFVERPSGVREGEWLSPGYGASTNLDLARSLSFRLVDAAMGPVMDAYRAPDQDPGLPHQLFRTRRILQATITATETRRVNRLARAFAASHDPEVMHLMRSCAQYGKQFANWLAGEPQPLSHKKRHLPSAMQEAGGAPLADARPDAAPFAELEFEEVAFEQRPADPWAELEVRSQSRSLFDRQVSSSSTSGSAYTPPPPADPELALRRRQAVRAYPVAALSMSNRDSRRLRAAIDEGRPLAPALASHWQVKPAVIKSLHGTTWQRAGRDTYYDTRIAAQRLGRVPREWHPTSRKEWADFTAVSSQAEHFASLAKRDVADVMRETRGDWARYAGYLADNPVFGISDMNQSIRKSVIVPALLQDTRDSAAASDRGDEAGEAEIDLFRRAGRRASLIPDDALIGKRSFRECLEVSARWHHALPRIRDTLRDESMTAHDRHWQPLAGQVNLGNDIEAVELTSPGDLAEEGIRQGHCVGGYTNIVLSGSSVIFSIRRGDRILATTELAVPGRDRTHRAGSDNGFRILQNYGAGNTPPGEQAQKAARTLARKLRPIHRDREGEYAHGLSTFSREWDVSQMHQVTGYDPRDRSRLELAFEIHREFLPKADRSASLDTWIKKVAPAMKEDETDRVFHGRWFDRLDDVR